MDDDDEEEEEEEEEEQEEEDEDNLFTVSMQKIHAQYHTHACRQHIRNQSFTSLEYVVC